jgi:hypothetical protein
VTAARTGRQLVDLSMRVSEHDDDGLRVALGYLIGASARSIAVRRALVSALDAADTARQQADQVNAPW